MAGKIGWVKEWQTSCQLPTKCAWNKGLTELWTTPEMFWRLSNETIPGDDKAERCPLYVGFWRRAGGHKMENDLGLDSAQPRSRAVTWSHTLQRAQSSHSVETQPEGEQQGREHSQEALGDPEERSRRLCSAGDEEGGFESRLDRTCRAKHWILGLRNWKDRVAISWVREDYRRSSLGVEIRSRVYTV